MNVENATSAVELTKVFTLCQKVLGRRIYLLIVLLPFSTLAEGIGFTLLLPLLSRLDQSKATNLDSSGFLSEALESLALPDSPLALLSVIAFFFVLKAALKFAAEAFKAVLLAELVTTLKANLIDSYTKLSYRSFAAKNTGHYVNLATSQTSLVGQSLQMLVLTATQAVSAMVFLVIAALVNWQFAAVAAVSGAIFAAVTLSLTRMVAGVSRKTVMAQTSLNTQVVQILHSLKYLMATNGAEHPVKRIRKVCDSLYGFKVKTGLANGLLASVREPLSVILILFLVGIQILYFAQPLSHIFVALILLDRATKAILATQGSWQKTMETVGAVESVQQELAFVSDCREMLGKEIACEFNSEVQFSNVKFAYEAADGNVLKGINLRIPLKQTIAIVGSSGAGKSTVADILTLLLTPTSGKLLIDGIASTNLDQGSWRKQIGYVCQETVVFDETIAANICLHEDLYPTDDDVRERVHDAAAQAFASSFIEAMPDGFNTVVGDRGVRLSGGQRQRLFIARELYKKPRLLLLDEATSALDAESEKAIQDGIEALHGQVTVVLIAHRLATIKNADYIYVLENGEVVEEGSYPELTSSGKTRFSRMVELQSL